MTVAALASGLRGFARGTDEKNEKAFTVNPFSLYDRTIKEKNRKRRSIKYCTATVCSQIKRIEICDAGSKQTVMIQIKGEESGVRAGS